MKLSEAKIKALKLMNEYTTNGVEVSTEANADYLNRFMDFADDAHKEIANIFPIFKQFTVEQTGTTDIGLNSYPAPSDFKEVDWVKKYESDFFQYRFEGNNFIIAKCQTGTFLIQYIAYPSDVDSDDFEFETDPETHNLIPYYMAGMALMDENTALSDKLLNMYYGKIAALKKKTDRFPGTIIDVTGW